MSVQAKTLNISEAAKAKLDRETASGWRHMVEKMRCTDTTGSVHTVQGVWGGVGGWEHKDGVCANEGTKWSVSEGVRAFDSGLWCISCNAGEGWVTQFSCLVCICSLNTIILLQSYNPIFQTLTSVRKKKKETAKVTITQSWLPIVAGESKLL